MEAQVYVMYNLIWKKKKKGRKRPDIKLYSIFNP